MRLLPHADGARVLQVQAMVADKRKRHYRVSVERLVCNLGSNLIGYVSE